jgi:hypothetical protein
VTVIYRIGTVICCCGIFVLVFLLIRFRILGSVYRGKHFQNRNYLTRAVKIIMHISTAYTRTHPQRTHPLLAARPEVVVDPAAPPPPPPPPDVDTGLRWADMARFLLIEMWYLGCWWKGKITWLSERKQAVSVLILFSSEIITGIKPQHIRRLN